MSIRSITDQKNIKNKRILLRLDLNEPISEAGKLLDDFRIQSALFTIQKLAQNNKVIVIAHLGRPEGQINNSLSLRPVAKRLADLLQKKFVETNELLPNYAVGHLIFYTGDLRLEVTAKFLEQQKPNDVVVLENIRFYPEEEKNDPAFAKTLSALADIYVNDAFSVSHRAESSNTAITKFLPSFAGPLLLNEVSSLEKLLSSKVKQPFVVLMGGIKIADKAQTIMNLSKRAEKILLSGGLANLFFHTAGYHSPDSEFDTASVQLAKQLWLNLKPKLVLPQDVVVYSDYQRSGNKVLVRKLSELNPKDKIYDIGPETILQYTKILQTSKTICWNGPLGVFEQKPYRSGTMSIAKIVGSLGKRRAYVVAGGGETVAAIRLAGQVEHLDHLSTGGGAMLALLAGEKLPGIEALKK